MGGKNPEATQRIQQPRSASTEWFSSWLGSSTVYTQRAVYTVAGVKHILLSSVSFTVCAAFGM